MGELFFASDLHFRHGMCAAKRGFSCPDAHDRAIVENWNSVVSDDDTVWVLGDVMLGKPALAWGYVDKLKGTRHLILGNHDAPFPAHRDSRIHQRAWMDHFASVQSFATIRMEGQPVLLSHFPYQGSGDHTAAERFTQYRLPDLGEWLIHGHLHAMGYDGSPEPTRGKGKMIHAGLDAWGLRPVRAADIGKIIREASAGA